MSELEKKVERYRDNLLRMTELRKGLIDAEISLVSLRTALNLSSYDWKKLVNGELEEREPDVWELIDKTPEHIKSRDKVYKHFLLIYFILLLSISMVFHKNFFQNVCDSRQSRKRMLNLSYPSCLDGA